LKGKYLLVLFPLMLVPLFTGLEAGKAYGLHDVAVTQVIVWPYLTLPSYVNANVTVENRGASYETFNVTMQSDSFTAASVAVVDLTPGSNQTLRLKCDLFPCRAMIFPPPWMLIEPMVTNVSLRAEASTVAGEVNVSDNVCIGGSVSITWWCVDLNGDGRINILDLAIMAKAFGNGVHPDFLDIDGDGTITIMEMAMVARAFGKVYLVPELN
jgi:hypothetical protein